MALFLSIYTTKDLALGPQAAADRERPLEGSEDMNLWADWAVLSCFILFGRRFERIFLTKQQHRHRGQGPGRQKANVHAGRVSQTTLSTAKCTVYITIYAVLGLHKA